MSDFVQFTTFMRWPLLACILFPGILLYLGLHIIKREIIFVDLALAQVAALGTCLAILLNHHDDWRGYALSLGFTLVGAAIFTLTRTQQEKVPQEALIGIIYVVAAAAGILLLSRSAEGAEELKKTLVGDVLLVSGKDILKNLGIYLGIGIAHFLFRKQFLALTFDHEKAMAMKLKVRLWDFLFYCLFGIVVTSFVQIGGVLLTFSYLIVPAVCANFLTEGLGKRMAVGWALAAVFSVAALYLCFKFDLPTGAGVVCSLGVALLLTLIVSKFRR